MALPQTEEQLRSTLDAMKAGGAPDDQIKLVIDDFFDRQGAVQTKKETSGGVFSKLSAPFGGAKRQAAFQAKGAQPEFRSAEEAEAAVTAMLNQPRKGPFGVLTGAAKTPLQIAELVPGIDLPEEAVTGQSPSEKLGKTTADIASIFAGGGAGTRVGTGITSQIAAKAPQGTKLRPIVEKGLPFLTRSAGETAAFTAATEGRAPKAQELVLGAGGDLLVTKMLKFFPKAKNTVVAATSDFVDRIKRGGLSKSAFATKQKVLETPVFQNKAGELAKIQEAHMLDEIKNPSAFGVVGEKISKTFDNAMKRRSKIGKKIGDFFEKNKVKIDDSALRSKVKEVADSYGIKLSEKNGKLVLGDTPFAESGMQLNPTVEKRFRGVVDAINKASKSKNQGLAYRRVFESISDLQPSFKTNVAQQVGAKETVMLGDVTKAITNVLDDAATKVDVEDFAKLKEEYKRLSTARDLMNTRLGQEGSGGFQIAKQLFSDGKYGTEVRRALDIISDFTDGELSIFDEANIAKLVAELSGDAKAQSLLNLAGGRSGVVDMVGGFAQDLVSGNPALYQELVSNPQLSTLPIGTINELINVLGRTLFRAGTNQEQQELNQ